MPTTALSDILCSAMTLEIKAKVERSIRQKNANSSNFILNWIFEEGYVSVKYQSTRILKYLDQVLFVSEDDGYV